MRLVSGGAYLVICAFLLSLLAASISAEDRTVSGTVVAVDAGEVTIDEKGSHVRVLLTKATKGDRKLLRNGAVVTLVCAVADVLVAKEIKPQQGADTYF